MTVTNPAKIPPETTSVTVRGRVTEPGLYIDPSTGLSAIAKDTFVAFYTDDVVSISGADEKFVNWTVTFTTPGGEVKNGRLQEPLINRTLGYVQSQLMKKT